MCFVDAGTIYHKIPIIYSQIYLHADFYDITSWAAVTLAKQSQNSCDTSQPITKQLWI